MVKKSVEPLRIALHDAGLTVNDRITSYNVCYTKLLRNLKSVDACITRLRLTLHDAGVVNDAVLKALGAKGIVRLGGNNLQVILGPQAEIIAAEMKSIPADQDLSAVFV